MTKKEILLKGENIQLRIEEDGLFITGNSLVIQTLLNEEVEWNYKNPVIPDGYTYVGGGWNNGFTIKDKKNNLWVWVPVAMLPEDGLFDRKSSKFGRRNFHKSEAGFARNFFSKDEFHEEISKELKKQHESVTKYGGFYVTKYLISKDKKGNPRVVQGVMPCNKITFSDAKELADQLSVKDSTESHVLYGSEYDSICQWLITSGAKTYEEVVIDSTSWGNYWNSEGSKHEISKTGARKEYYANGIADLAGNLWIWTQERYADSEFCVRGSSCHSNGYDRPVVCRNYYSPSNFYDNVGLRAALYVK